MDATEAQAGERAATDTAVSARPSPTLGHVAGQIALASISAAWVVVLALALSRRIVLAPDSVNNHAHVWWIAENLWHRGVVPWRMPILGHGAAFTFPYGLVNWTTAAVVWPLFGDWAVTLWTVVGSVGCLVATFYAFPELRRGVWLPAAVLANPAVWYGLLFAQQTFVWAAALLLFGIAMWRRGHPLAAAILVGLGQANHPAVVLPIGVVVVAVWCVVGHEDRRRLLSWYALSLAISLPPALLVVDSPVYADSTLRDRIVNFFSTLGPRVPVVALPIAFVVLWRRWPRFAPAAFVVAVGFTAALWWPLGANRTVPPLLGRRAPDNASVQELIQSGAFRPGAIYRVLRAPNDSKYTMYALLRHGGRADSEFFPESMAHRDFRQTGRYGDLLCKRRVDFVLVYPSFTFTNEPRLLHDAATTGAPLGAVKVRIELEDATSTVYAVDRSGCPLDADHDST